MPLATMSKPRRKRGTKPTQTPPAEQQHAAGEKLPGKQPPFPRGARRCPNNCPTPLVLWEDKRTWECPTCHRTETDRASGADGQLSQVLDTNLKRMRQRLESDEQIDEEELDEIDEALDELEPPRQFDNVPAAAVTKEGQIAHYGFRYDKGFDLWNPMDAFSLRQRDRLSRRGVMEIYTIGADGVGEWTEVAVRYVHGSSEVEIIGAVPPGVRPHDPKGGER